MAEITSSRFLLALLIAASLVANGVSDCMGDVNSLREKCFQYVSASGPMTPPDTSCCAVIKKADVPCVCSYVTPPVRKIISPAKIVYVSKQCGRPITKCGSAQLD
ncbi:hypothetical protein LUZ60_000754 [Juncus effusus]|nr:hypothetical protein LUZ60_000754 [Juncus effusus]